RSVPGLAAYAWGAGPDATSRAREPADRAVRIGFARRDDKDASHVVGAVAVCGARHRVIGVLERAASVGHRREVGEAGRWRDCHETAATGATSWSATDA